MSIKLGSEFLKPFQFKWSIFLSINLNGIWIQFPFFQITDLKHVFQFFLVPFILNRNLSRLKYLRRHEKRIKKRKRHILNGHLSLRTAYANELSLGKEQTPYNDLFDALDYLWRASQYNIEKKFHEKKFHENWQLVLTTRSGCSAGKIDSVIATTFALKAY